MRVGIVGPGRVGTALALALPAAGHPVVAVCGRPGASLDGFLARIPQAVDTPIEQIGRAVDLVVVAVPDDALSGLARAAAAADGIAEGTRWVHVSGGHGPGVLRPVALAGAEVAACHPAQTFPDPDAGLAALPGTSWAVTAEGSALRWARVLVTDLRGRPVDVPAASRTLYHAGLTVGSNATASVVTLARDLLLGAGVEDPAAFLGPLVTTTAANAVAGGARALTGPVRRGDAGTVARHLAELEAVMPEVAGVYRALSSLMLAQARRAGLDPEQADAVAEVLE